jgi:hypothetical protein
LKVHQALFKHVINHDHFIQVYNTWLMRLLKTVSINHSKHCWRVPEAKGHDLDLPKTLTHPCLLDADSAANRSSGSESRTIWLQPKCSQFKAAENNLSSVQRSLACISSRRAGLHPPSWRELHVMSLW